MAEPGWPVVLGSRRFCRCGFEFEPEIRPVGYAQLEALRALAAARESEDAHERP